MPVTLNCHGLVEVCPVEYSVEYSIFLLPRSPLVLYSGAVTSREEARGIRVNRLAQGTTSRAGDGYIPYSSGMVLDLMVDR